MNLIFPRIAFIFLCVIILIAFNSSAIFSDTTVKIISQSAESEFPSGIKFNIEAESDTKIEEIALQMKFGQQKSGVYEYFKFETSDSVSTELFWNTNTASKYVPPGTIVFYSFEIMTSDGNKTNSDQYQMIFYDSRFDWDEISEGMISVAYHGPVANRAKEILETIIETTKFMSPIVGDLEEEPIRVTIYNNVREMLPALPPGSETIRRELITEGQAFVDFGTLMILAAGDSSLGTAAHEVTHILVHRAGDSVFRNIPSWLDEGLAEYGNKYPAFSYDTALDYAIHMDKLLPITSMPTMPGTPEDIIIYYGQSKSLIEYLINVYGTQNMKALLSTMKSGTNVDDAFQIVYGKTKEEVENEWRDYIGASLYDWKEGEVALPTPVPRPDIKVFSLTPQPGSNVVQSIESDSITNIRSTGEESGNIVDSRSCASHNDSSSNDISAFFLIAFVNVLKFRKSFILRKINYCDKRFGEIDEPL